MTSILSVALALVYACVVAVAATDTCVAFGNEEIGVRSPCGKLSGQTLPLTSSIAPSAQVLWAIILPEGGLAFTMSNNLLVFWDSTAASGFESVSIAPMTTPVGAVYLNDKIYVACFGSWPTPNGDSGLAVVDVKTRMLEATYSYSDPRKHVHNVYAMEWNESNEIFVAVLGNPWLTPALAGDGLVRFDQATNQFSLPAPGAAGSLSVRSAKQESATVFYVLTQEPSGAQSKLARLEKHGTDLAVAGSVALLPPRSGGDGGADVLLGAQAGTVFATDRTNAGGKIYYYVWESGAFHQKAAHDTGSNPRYTVALAGGDVVSCNQDDGTLTVFGQLFANPMAATTEITTIPTVKTPMFFWEGATPTTPPSPMPTPMPTQANHGRCCFSLQAECAVADSCEDGWCGESQTHCEGRCNGKWCPVPQDAIHIFV